MTPKKIPPTLNVKATEEIPAELKKKFQDSLTPLGFKPLPEGFPIEVTMDVKQIRSTVHSLNTANETITTLRNAYKKIAVEYHMARVGGTALHSGSFDHCQNKGCREHRAVLTNIN